MEDLMAIEDSEKATPQCSVRGYQMYRRQPHIHSYFLACT